MSLFAKIPPGTLIDPVPFKIGIHDTAIEELSLLLRLSKIAKPTYENTTKDVNFGVSREWLDHAVKFWREEFDWYEHSNLGFKI